MSYVKRKTLTTLFLVIFTVSFVMFIGITQILRVPLWWIFSFPLLSGVQFPKLLVTVTPETPLSIGQIITVTVTNSSNHLPVENAEVLVMKEGMERITLYTDSNGQVIFEYFGEVTVVMAQKTGIDSSALVAIPKLPEAWVRNTILSLGIAVIGGFVSGVTTYMLQQRKEKTSEKKVTKKVKSEKPKTKESA